MKILDVKQVVFPEIKIITYARFTDGRGFFAEIYRKSDFQNEPRLNFLKNKEFVQSNVSFSKKGVFRGLHFQWDPVMDKLVRVQEGKMIDLFLDIRKGSPTYGKIAGYQLDTAVEDNLNEWIWIPVGFAHGSVFLEETLIEYFCSAEYTPANEAGISPLSKDIDWSLMNGEMKKIINDVITTTHLISDKDRNGLTVKEWGQNPASENFTYSS